MIWFLDERFRKQNKFVPLKAKTYRVVCDAQQKSLDIKQKMKMDFVECVQGFRVKKIGFLSIIGKNQFS